MHSIKHAALGAALGASASVLPDTLLIFFGWRRDWLPDTHPLVRAHRFIHSGRGLLFVFLIGWASHIIADWLTPHRSGPCD